MRKKFLVPALAVLIGAGAATAQQTPDRPAGQADRPAGQADQPMGRADEPRGYAGDRDHGPDLGWIGLLGLAGLFGLRRRTAGGTDYARQSATAR
jgi:MYXO-CTERM domain-containing protein